MSHLKICLSALNVTSGCIQEAQHICPGTFIVVLVCLKSPQRSRRYGRQIQPHFYYLCIGLQIYLIKRANGPFLVAPISLRYSHPVTINSDPFTSFLTRVGPTKYGIPLMVATHLATSSLLQYCINTILS